MAKPQSPYKLKTTWTQSIRDPEEKVKFEQHVLSSQKVLDKLREIVYNKVLDGEKVKVVDYDNPSWSHRQADLNGYVRGLREVIELLTFGDHDQ